MKWNKYRLSTTEAAEDIVTAVLAECGIEGVEIVDKAPLTEEEKRQMFVDIAPEPEADDGSAFLYFYLDPAEDTGAVLKSVREALEELRAWTDIGSGAIDISETEDVDWINNWKQYFHQFSVDDLLIVPSWETVREEDRDRMILHIDPGTAFGTGMHETTQLCIRQIRKYIQPGCEVLDIGTGSGILSIAALLCGAGHALGTDLDPCTENAVLENCAANGISCHITNTEEMPQENAEAARMELLLGNLIDDPAVQKRAGHEKYDIVTANILAEILVPLMPAAAAALKSGGICITSGILEEKEGIVREAAEKAGLVWEETTQQGEWVSVTLRKDVSCTDFS